MLVLAILPYNKDFRACVSWLESPFEGSISDGFFIAHCSLPDHSIKERATREDVNLPHSQLDLNSWKAANGCQRETKQAGRRLTPKVSFFNGRRKFRVDNAFHSERTREVVRILVFINKNTM